MEQRNQQEARSVVDLFVFNVVLYTHPLFAGYLDMLSEAALRLGLVRGQRARDDFVRW